MQENKGSSSENSHEGSSNGKGKDFSDGLVNELKNLLDGLKVDKPAGLPPLKREPPAESGLPPADPKMGRPGESENGSDSDFWNGNVLGWPATPEQHPSAPPPDPFVGQELKKKKPEDSIDAIFAQTHPVPPPLPPVEPPAPRIEALPPLPPVARPSPPASKLIDPFMEAPPAPPAPPTISLVQPGTTEPLLGPSSSMPAPTLPPPPMIEPLPPPPSIPSFTPDPFGRPMEFNKPVTPRSKPDFTSTLPLAGLPPLSPPPPPAAPPSKAPFSVELPPSPRRGDMELPPVPGSPFDPPLPPEPVAPESDSKAIGNLPDFDPMAMSGLEAPGADAAGDMFAPIPGTLDEVQKAVPAPVEEAKQKPKPREKLKVAVIYPASEKQVFDYFMKKVKESADRYKKPFDIDPVHTQTWSLGKVEISAWKKSAQDAGAKHLFVLVPRADKALFRTLSTDKELPAVLVLMEHVDFRELYASIVVDMAGGKNGKG